MYQCLLRFFGVLMCPYVSCCFAALRDLPVPRLWMALELHIFGLNYWRNFSPTTSIFSNQDGVIQSVFESELPQYQPCWPMLRLLGKLNEKVNRKLSKCLDTLC